MATSTTEAEYMSLFVAARQAIWYLHGSQEFGLTIPTTVRCDNTSAISISIVSNCSKHIAIHYHFVRESVIYKKFELDYVDTSSNPADIFTKSLVAKTHSKFMQQLKCII